MSEENDTRRIPVEISAPVYDRLTEYCEDTGESYTEVIDRVLEGYLDSCQRERNLIMDDDCLLGAVEMTKRLVAAGKIDAGLAAKTYGITIEELEKLDSN